MNWFASGSPCVKYSTIGYIFLVTYLLLGQLVVALLSPSFSLLFWAVEGIDLSH